MLQGITCGCSWKTGLEPNVVVELAGRSLMPLAIVRRRKRFVINLRDGRSIVLGDRTVVVGVLNVTPDSFSDGGLHFDVVQAVDRALELEAEGADIVEIGGESTRPGSVRVSAEEELSRVLPVLRKLTGRIRIPIAIDTYKSEVAFESLAQGASMVNDISALRFDPSLASVVAR